jgi:hypothetical protein
MSKIIYPEYKAQPGSKIDLEPIVLPEGNKAPGRPLMSNTDISGNASFSLPGSNVMRIRPDGTLYMEDINRLPIMSFESIRTSTMHADQTITIGGAGTTDWRLELSGATSTYPMRYWNGTTVKFSLDDAGNVVISGTLTAGEIHIPSAATGANSFHVDSSGNVWWSSVTLAAATTYIKSSGEASFYGQDVILGDYAGGQGAKWDQGTGIFEVLGDITANNVLIGTGNNVFKADANGIYLGNATFGSAPFRVNMTGALVASSVNLTGTIKATSGYIGGTTNGWEISTGYIKSTSGDIELKGTTTSHIKALVDASNYVQVTAASGIPRVDLYTNGKLRSRLSDIGITLYDENEVERGNLSGNSGGYGYFNISDLRISSGASEVRIWSSGVRVKEGKGFFCEDNTGSSYLRMFTDSGTHAGVIDFPTTDYLQIKDNSNNAIINFWGKDWYSTNGLVDLLVPLCLNVRSSNPASPKQGTIFLYSDGVTRNVRVWDGLMWQVL